MDEAILRDALAKLTEEEKKLILSTARKRLRRRPERLKIKSLQVMAETKRGLKPMLISKTGAEFIVHGHNPDRVTLGSIGNLDFYCYPRLWNDRVFVGLYPNSVQIEATNVSQLLACAWRAFWAIRRGMDTKRIKEISTVKKSNRGFKSNKNQIGGKFGAKKSDFD